MELEKQLEFEFMEHYKSRNEIEEERKNNRLCEVTGILSGVVLGLIITHPQEVYAVIKSGLTYHP